MKGGKTKGEQSARRSARMSGLCRLLPSEQVRAWFNCSSETVCAVVRESLAQCRRGRGPQEGGRAQA